jgi:hypothetical protein
MASVVSFRGRSEREIFLILGLAPHGDIEN